MRTGVTARVSSLMAGAVLVSSLAVSARADEMLTVSVGGGLATAASDWSSQASWPSWAETATLAASYKAASGSVFQGGLGFRFAKHLGIGFAVSRASRDVSASLVAKIPHPLFLNSPRTVNADASGLKNTELAFHLDLEWRTRTGPFEIALFAGPTMMRIDSDVVQMVNVTETYPYDQAAFQSATTASVRSNTAFGFNGGASLAWVPVSHLDLGVEGRYVRASVDLAPTGAKSFSVTAGGLQVVAQARLRF